MSQSFFIKAGYLENHSPVNYQDTVEDSATYQLEVYHHAAQLVIRHRLGSILDVGCGLGTKLVALADSVGGTLSIAGIDQPTSIEYCRRTHTRGIWATDDLEDPSWPLAGSRFDLVLSADVIEHLLNPGKLLSYAKAHLTANGFLVISTPERDLRRGRDDMGPPANPAHVREWNGVEFSAFLTAHGWRILDHLVVDLREGVRTCQMVVAQPCT